MPSFQHSNQGDGQSQPAEETLVLTLALTRSLLGRCSIGLLFDWAAHSGEEAQSIMGIEIKRRVTDLLHHRIKNMHDFWVLFRDTRSVIGGQFLCTLLDPLQREKTHVLDIFCPNNEDAYTSWVEHIQKVEKGVDLEAVDGPTHLPAYAYEEFTHFRTSHSDIRIIRSPNEDATWPITFYDSTSFINFLDASSLIVAYPTTTFQRRGAVRDMDEETEKSTSFELAPMDSFTKPSCDNATCARLERRWRDKWVSFIEWHEKEGDDDVTLTWKLGGPGCNDTCPGADSASTVLVAK